MDAETAERIDKLEARVSALESVLGDMEDVALAEVDPVVRQHREFAARIRAKRASE